MSKESVEEICSMIVTVALIIAIAYASTHGGCK